MPGTGRTVLAVPEAGNQQWLVNERFDSHAQDWDELYQKDDLFSVIIRHRHDRALGWIDDLELTAGSRVLEIGPGAGLMTAALARRGFRVTGADSAPRMIEIARRRAEQAVTTQGGYADQGEATAAVGLMLADAQRLPFAAKTFSLVVALGVVPWLNSAQVAADEMARVLRPGGYLLLNASNRHRLSLLLDPWHWTVLDRLRAGAKRALTAAGIRRLAARPAVTAHRLREFDQILVRAGLQQSRACTVGFGQFTLLRFPVLPDRLGVRVNVRMQQLADRGTPGLRRAGNHYLVLARRPPSKQAEVDSGGDRAGGVAEPDCSGQPEITASDLVRGRSAMRGTRPAYFADPAAGGQQHLVTERFHAHARVWEDLYERNDLISVIVRHRHNRALAWIDGLRLQPESPALEIGPGAGMMTTALAQRRFLVTGVDTAPGMIEIARRRATAAGVAGRVRLLIGDANRLAFADGEFSLVVALGVLAWLRPARTAVAEMARVLRPGGYLIVNAENRHRLNVLLDPRHYPALDPARLAAKAALRSVGITRLRDQRARVAAHRLAEFDRMLAGEGLQIVKRCTLGFGPFTLMGRPALSDQLGVRLNARLQAFADRGVPGLRSTGGQYLVLAYRPPE